MKFKYSLLHLPLLFSTAFADEAKTPLQEGLQALRAGEYDQAIASFKKAADANDLPLEARRGWAQALAATGRHEEALELLAASAGFEASAPLLAEAGRLHLRTGKLAEAKAALEQAAALAAQSPETPSSKEGSPEILYLLGEAHRRSGGLDAARSRYEQCIEIYKEIEAEAAEKLPAETYVYWGLALIALNRYKEAHKVMFSQAADLDPKNPFLLLEEGRMFFDKYNFPDSRKSYQEAIDQNPAYAEALAALAENYITDFQEGTKRFEQAEKFLARALQANPRHAEAYTNRGRIWYYDGNLEKAMEDFRKASAENPSSLKARGLLAACHFLRGDGKSLEQAEAEALAINPKGAEFFHTMAVNLEQKFRYFDCVRFCDRALEADPDYWPAYVTLGINCLRTGEIERGRKFLDRSWEKDNYNVWVFNTRQLLRHMDKNYASFQNDRFIFSLPKEDLPILRPYLEPLLDRAYKDLSERYRLKIAGPIHLECFSEHKWFSARTVGLEGFAASGACFGKLVTLTTAKALPQNWGAVAWHEFAHVVTLQLTEHRVPRWLTEGISVYEEGQGEPQWARNFQRDLADSWASGRLLPIAELDFGFSKPKYPMQILISYFQGCLVVQYVSGKWGFDAVLKLLEGYRQNRSTEPIFKEVLGESLADFDRGFGAYLKAWVEKNGYEPRLGEETIPVLTLKHEKDPKDVKVVVDLAWAQLCNDKETSDARLTAGQALELDPENADAHALLGLVHHRNKKSSLAMAELEKALQGGTRFQFEANARLGDLYAKEKGGDKAWGAKAIEKYEEAKRISPIAGAGFPPGGGNLYYKLAKLYEEAGDGEKAIQQMEALARFATEDPECRFRIVQYALEKKDYARAAKPAEDLLYINPYEVKFHQARAQIAEALGDPDTVIREMNIVILDPRSSPLRPHLALAKAYLAKGNKPKAAAEAEKVLKIDPDNAAAKEIRAQAGGAPSEPASGADGEHEKK